MNMAKKSPKQLPYPVVTKRTRKVPSFLDFDHNEREWQNYDIEWSQNVLSEDRSTEFKQATAYTSDCFYRLENTNDPWQYGYSRVNVRYSNKYTLIGGPLNGQRGIIGTEDYVAYNCAENHGSKKTWPTNVLVHKSLIEQIEDVP